MESTISAPQDRRTLPRMDFLGQPACPICGTVMADIPNGYICRECNTAWSPNVHLEPRPDANFSGSSIHGG